jgi:hypothetical protein
MKRLPTLMPMLALAAAVLAIGCGSSSTSSGAAGSTPAATTSSKGPSTAQTTPRTATSPIPAPPAPEKGLSKHQLAVRACNFLRRSAPRGRPKSEALAKALAQCKTVR